MPSATATLSEFLRPNQPEIVRGERRLARGCPWSEPLGPRHGSRTTASQRASSSGARPCLIPGHLGSSRLISRPISGRRSRVGRGAANLRESLKRRLRGHFGEEAARSDASPAPLVAQQQRAPGRRRREGEVVRVRCAGDCLNRDDRHARRAELVDCTLGAAAPVQVHGCAGGSRSIVEAWPRWRRLTTIHGLCVGRSLHGRRANLGDAAPLPRDSRVRAHRGAGCLRQEYLTDRQ